MTEYLIRAASRHPLTRLVRPSAVLAFSLALAYAGGLWLVVLHHVEGGRERGEPGLLVHWLRDSTLSLPTTLITVWCGVLLARRLITRSGAGHSPVLATLVLAAVVAWLQSVVMGALNPVHNALFGGHHAGHDLGYLQHATRDGLVALPVLLLVGALISLALVRRAPWELPRVTSWRAPRGKVLRAALQLAVLLLVLAPGALLVQNRVEVAAAGGGGGAPCPAQAPVRAYDVSAIDVDIPLNRFGDHDPQGRMYVLTSRIADVRAEEQSRHASLGLRDDAIQPLNIRANVGECVQITFTNRSAGDTVGIHVDGLAYDVASSGDAIGRNPASSAAPGETRTYTYYVPRDPALEGAHLVRPGPGNRAAVNHGLFGSLTVEPEGSTWTNMITGEPIESGWQASVSPGSGKDFREYVQQYHEIGDEKFAISTSAGGVLPTVDPHTSSYRPGSRAMNYRSEPFMNRLNRQPKGDSHGYGAYTFGDPPVAMPRGYLGDPTKIRLLHAGSEIFHVFHLHGGGIRWRMNPHADTTYDYQDTGLNKSPKAQRSSSSRLDSQAMGPGESYDLEIEGGAGGVQQVAGEFLFHCHIAEHYISGMWSFWRVYDTLQVDLKPLLDRAPLPAAVDSTQLIGKTMADGTTLTKDNLNQWIDPQLPPPGVRPRAADGQTYDASTWDWTTEPTAAGPLYLGEPEDQSSWANFTTPADRERLPGHPALFPGDQPVGPLDRPKILFNPTNGRPAFPLMRTHVGDRPPFAPNLHSGAPWLGENADKAPSGTGPDPWANRPDGLCPADAPLRRFNVVALELPIQVTKSGATDQFGKIFVLAQDVDDVLAGRKAAQPLAIRGNIGDCIAVTLTSRLTDVGAADGFSKVNMHIHHLQFDTQASDGVISGMSFEQSVRPYTLEDTQLTAAAQAGDQTVHLASTAKFRDGTAIAIGEGTDQIEVRKISSVDTAAGTVTLDRALAKDHASGHWAGQEFTQYRWYPDVELDNIFWHDHVDGIHTWGHGLVGQFIVEPKGSTYHDPTTGAEVPSGTYVDVRTANALAPGVTGSFRELALWTLDENPATDSTLNLRAAPWSDRLATNSDPSLLFSSYTHGDPNTPLPRAYAGDPFVIRTINVGPQYDTIHVDGHRFSREPRFAGSDGKVTAAPVDTLGYSVSEKFTLVLEGGAGGVSQRSGDYLYMNGIGRRFRQGAWGVLRVLPRRVDDLQPLPGLDPPAGPYRLPAQTGGRPPAAGTAGDSCPSDAPTDSYDVSAVDVPGLVAGRTAAFVPTSDAAAVRSGAKAADPLVMHVVAGHCVEVNLTNERATARASFHDSELDHSVASSGINVGFNPEQTVAPGASRLYRFYADTQKLGGTIVSDFGALESGSDGLYGAINVAPAGATFTDPNTGAPTRFGSQVDVHVRGSNGYRDFTAIVADDDPVIGGSFMPYPKAVLGPAFLNMRSAPLTGARADDANGFSSIAHGDPATPLLRAYAGDPVKVHFMVAPGSEQAHVFSLGGQSWANDPEIERSNQVASQGLGPWQVYDAELSGGAGGPSRSAGDSFYGDLRRSFTQAGVWGLMRVMRDTSCPIKPLDGLDCAGQAALPDSLATGLPRPGSGSSGGGGGSQDAPKVVSPKSGSGPLAPASAPAAATSTRGTLRGLRVRRRITLSELGRHGLWVQLLAPADARVLQLQLTPVRRGTAIRQLLRLPRGGAVATRWKPGIKVIRKLRRGQYRLTVRAGSAPAKLWAPSVSAPIELRGTALVVISKRARR